MTPRALLDQLLLRGTTEMFRAGGIELGAPTDRRRMMEYAAVVGFSGDQLRGVVGLGMAATTLHGLVASTPLRRDTILEDWLGEAANQLLGRVKNRLLSYGVVLHIALPTVLRGVELRLLSSRESVLCTFAHESSAGDVCTWLDVVCDRDLSLVLSDDPSIQSVPEGALELF